MTVGEDHVELHGPSKPRRPRGLFVVAVCCLLLAAVLGAYARGVFTRNASPYDALNAYTSAVSTGDRNALEAAIADTPRRQALIDSHAGKPMIPTSVSMETMNSEVWWSVEIRYEVFGQQPHSERLLIHPRDDSPHRPINYVVEPAP